MNKTKIPNSLPTPTAPYQAVREYYIHLNKYANRFIELMRLALKDNLPYLRGVASEEAPDATDLRMDSVNRMDTNIEKRVAEMLEWVERELSWSFSDLILQKWAKSMVANTNKISKRNIGKTTKAVGLDIEPLLHDKELNPFFQNMIDQNVGLIKSIPTDRMVSFKNQLVFGITQDMPAAQIEKIITKYIGKDGNVKQRAKLIARDQVGKLNAELNKYRQQQLGGKRYIWRGTRDEREAGNPSGKYPKAKPSHWAREGKIYSWDKPPEGGHPGQRVNCRCHAEMIIEDILE